MKLLSQTLVFKKNTQKERQYLTCETERAYGSPDCLWHCLGLGSRDSANRSYGNGRLPQYGAHFECKTGTLLKTEELF